MKWFPRLRQFFPGLRSVLWIPVVVSLVVALLSFLLWRALKADQLAESQREATLASASATNEIAAQINSRMLALVRIGWRWEVVGTPTQQEWETDAYLYLRAYPGLKGIGWVDPSGELRWFVSKQEADSGIDWRQEVEARYREAYAAAKEQAQPLATPTFNMTQGGKGFLGCVAVASQRGFDGVIVGLFSVQELLADTLRENVVPGYDLAIFDGQEEIYRRAKGEGQPEGPQRQETDLRSYGAAWRITVWPEASPAADRGVYLPAVVLASGLLMALVLPAVLYFAQVAQGHAQETEAAMQKLKTEVLVRRLAEEGFRQQAQLVTQLREPLVSTDLSGCVTSWNLGAELFFGGTAEEVMGKYLPFISTQGRPDFFQQTLLASLREKGNQEFDLRLKKKSGEEILARLSLSFLYDDSGTAEGIIYYRIRPSEPVS